MADESDLELRITADASGVGPGAQQAQSQMQGLEAAMSSMAASMSAQTDVIREGFASLAAQSSATRRQIVEDSEAEALSLMEMVRAVHEGVESFNEFRNSLSEIAEVYMAAFMVEKVIDFAKEMGEAGEKTEHLATAFGTTTSEIQRLEAVFTAAGAGPEALQSSLMRLDRAASQAVSGNKRASEAFQRLGVDLTEPRTQAELLEETLQGFASIPGPEKAAVAMAIFGRNIETIAPLLGISKEQLEEFNEQAVRSGAVMPSATAQAGALGEAFNLNKVAMQGLGNVMADSLAPAFTQIVKWCTDLVNAFNQSYVSGGMARTVMDLIAVTTQVLGDLLEELAEVIGVAFDALVDGSDGGKMSINLLKEAIAGIGFLIVSLGYTFQVSFTSIKTIIDVVISDLATLGKVAVDALTLNWGAIQSDWKTGMDRSERVIRDGLKTIGDETKSAQDKMRALLDGPTRAPVKREDQVRSTPPVLGGGGREKKAPEEDALQRAREAFEAEEAAHRGMITNMTADELAFWEKYAQSAEFATLNDKQQAQVRLNIAKLGRQEDVALINQEIEDRRAATQDEIAQIQNTASERRAAIEEEIKGVQNSVKAGLTTRKDARSQTLALIEEERQAATDAATEIYNARVALDNFIMSKNDESTEAYHKAQQDEVRANDERNKAIIAATNAANKQIQATNAQAATQFKQDWDKVVNPLVSSFTSGLLQMAEGTKSFVQVLAQLGNQILSDFLTRVIDPMIERWIWKEGAQTVQSLLGIQQRQTAEAASATAGQVLQSTQAEAQVVSNAAVAGSGAAAAVAATPFIGPDLALTVGPEVMSAVLGTFGGLASASGGWGQIDQDQLAMVHKDEMVLPASIATPLRSSIASGQVGDQSSGSGGSSYGDIYLTSTDPRAFKQMLTENSGHLTDLLRREIRNMRAS